MPFTLRQTWPMQQGQAGRTEPDQVPVAPTSCSSIRRPHPGTAWPGGSPARSGRGITDGRLPAGTRLPATRLLAGQLGVSRGVVVEAYQRLTDEGLLSGRRGGGTTVLAAAPARPRPGTSRLPTRAPIDLRPGAARSLRVPAPGLAARRTRRAGPHAGRRTRLRRPARHRRAAHRARDVAGAVPRRARRPVGDRRRERGRPGPRAARAGARPARRRRPSATRTRARAAPATSWSAGDSRSPRSRWTTSGCDVDALARTGRGRRLHDPGAPVPDRRRARPAAPPRSPGLGPGRRPRHRGRLRRRAPLRPRAGGRARGARPRARRLPGQRVEDAGPGAAAGLGGRPAGRARGAGGAQAVVGHHQPRPRPARPRRAR